MDAVPTAPNDLLTPAEVATLLYVDPKTVSRWAAAGKIQSIRTPGGHRRFLRTEIEAMIAGSQAEPIAGPRPVIVQSSAAPQGYSDREESAHTDRVAAGLVAEAVTVASRAQAEHDSADLVAASDAVVAAARRTAAAARRSRVGRAQAAEEAADDIAALASRTASDLRFQADATARELTQTALEAASLVVAASQKSHDEEEAAAALQLADHVKAAAVSVAEDTAEAAVRVADAVTTAAAKVAFTVSATDVVIEGEVAKAAAALQFTATEHARQVAEEADARATETAIVARDAAQAVSRRDLEASTSRDPDNNQIGPGSTPISTRP